MTKTKIQMWPIARLLPYARTLRRNDDAVDRMVAAFKEFRLMLPLLVRSEGEIVDGHLRLKAARKLQLTCRSPVKVPGRASRPPKVPHNYSAKDSFA